MPTGLWSGNAGAHGVEDFERITHAVFRLPPYSSRALVGDRRQELVQQIAVRAVHLDAVDAEPVGAPGCIDEGVANAGSPAASSASAAPRSPCAARRMSTVCQPLAQSESTGRRPKACGSILRAGMRELHRHPRPSNACGTEARIGFSAAFVASPIARDSPV